MPSSNENKSPSSQSLAGKLAILYAITTFSVLLVASGLLYWSIHDYLQQEHQKLLTAKITDLRQYFKSSSVFGETLHDLIDVEHHHSQMPHSSAIHPGIPHHVLVRILNEQGDLLVESDARLPLSVSLEFPEVNEQDFETIGIVKVTPDNRLSYLLGSAWVIAESSGESSKLRIQVSLELAQDEALISEYQRTLAGVLVFGVLASALAGFWVTRRGLLPLRQITAAIQNINVQQLNERVDSGQWPKEIALLAKAFDEMLGRLDQSFGQLSRFSADLAHELRTPVNNLMGEAEVALSRDRDAQEYRHVLESNMEECTRIARMIDELLFLARAEDPKTEINCTVLQVENEFRAIKEFYSSVASEQKVEIVCIANQVELYADPGLLRRVLSNLISNAMRYTKPHGAITLSASYSSDKAVKITISDTGDGIATDLLPHIFDRFFRADKSRHRDSQGSGLGLAIVKSIMELHGGQIVVTSQIQQRTLVELSFPALQNS
jgi:two-component system heavy metal sensor histidine kinase CusS